MWINHSCCVQCAVPNISKGICNAKIKMTINKTRHSVRSSYLRSNIRKVLKLQTRIFAPMEMLHINLKSHCVNFLPSLPSVQSTIWQLYASLSAGSSVSSDRRLMDLQPMEGSWPPAVDMLPHARLYTHEMTPCRSSPAVTESYNIAGCVCLDEVKGHSGTNDHSWPSSSMKLLWCSLVSLHNPKWKCSTATWVIIDVVIYRPDMWNL